VVMQPKTKNDCAAKSQQQFTWPDQDDKKAHSKLLLYSWVVTEDRLLSSKRWPHYKTYKWPWKEQKICSRILMGPETKNDCDGEGLKQVIAGLWCS
jgi:hypothetical protein